MQREVQNRSVVFLSKADPLYMADKEKKADKGYSVDAAVEEEYDMKFGTMIFRLLCLLILINRLFKILSKRYVLRGAFRTMVGCEELKIYNHFQRCSVLT